MVESAFCNGSQRINATIADFADYNATLRLLLPYFLLACSAFSVLWNFGVIIQFAIHRFRRIPNKFDFFLFFTSFAELLSSTPIVTFAGIGSGFSRNYSETDAVKNTDNGDEITPYIIVSVFAFFRLYAILVYSPILINRFYSAKFPSEREFSLAVPREASPNGSFRFWVGNLVALSGAIALAVKGGDVSQNMYSCFYIMTKWPKCVLIVASYTIIVPSVLLLLFILKARIRIPRTVLLCQEERNESCANVDWFALEWGLTRMFVTVISVLYITWMPLLVVLTIYDDQAIAKHESIVLIALIIASLGLLTSPLLRITAQRYRQMSCECPCLDPLTNCFKYTFSPSEKTQRERERLLASNASHNRGSRTKPKTESSRIIRIQRTTVADYDSTSRRENHAAHEELKTEEENRRYDSCRSTCDPSQINAKKREKSTGRDNNQGSQAHSGRDKMSSNSNKASRIDFEKEFPRDEAKVAEEPTSNAHFAGKGRDVYVENGLNGILKEEETLPSAASTKNSSEVDLEIEKKLEENGETEERLGIAFLTDEEKEDAQEELSERTWPAVTLNENGGKLDIRNCPIVTRKKESFLNASDFVGDNKSEDKAMEEPSENAVNEVGCMKEGNKKGEAKNTKELLDSTLSVVFPCGNDIEVENKIEKEENKPIKMSSVCVSLAAAWDHNDVKLDAESVKVEKAFEKLSENAAVDCNTNGTDKENEEQVKELLPAAASGENIVEFDVEASDNHQAVPKTSERAFLTDDCSSIGLGREAKMFFSDEDDKKAECVEERPESTPFPLFSKVDIELASENGIVANNGEVEEPGKITCPADVSNENRQEPYMENDDVKEGEEVSKGQPQNHFPLVNPYTSDPDLESGDGNEEAKDLSDSTFLAAAPSTSGRPQAESGRNLNEGEESTCLVKGKPSEKDAVSSNGIERQGEDAWSEFQFS
ncbi:uncharacterized protein [Oscarella lobularis]|uniref:uncharacterized protein isoform X2 n=1 Tax=Oscarella lobularis TaxID=121494 RepID=UPI0033141C32